MVAPKQPSGAVSLAVIIVSYNVRELLRRCLASVYRAVEHSAGRLDVQVLVVDNASRDGSAAMVAEAFPQALLLALDENLGFTGGNNLALRVLGFAEKGTKDERRRTDDGGRGTKDEPIPQSPISNLPISQSPIPNPQSPITYPPDLILLLNPDTEIAPDALERMAACLLEQPDAGACGAQLRYGDGCFQHGAFRFPGLAQVALDLFPLAEVRGVRRFLPRVLDSRLNGRYPRSLWASEAPFPVDFVLGAALMVRREAIHQVGLLDDGFFMYCEEMDWCLRMQEAGWRIYAAPAARVIHHEGQSSKQVRWRSFERLWRSRLRFFRKHHNRYSSRFLLAVNGLLRIGLGLRAQLAWRAFAAGRVDGAALRQELTAYANVSRML